METKNETINQMVIECSKLTEKEYKTVGCSVSIYGKKNS